MIFCPASRYFLPFEGRGNVPAEALDEGAHLAFKRRALPGRKRKAGRARRVLKVVDVTPVEWSRCRLGQPLHHLPDECALASPDRPGDEHVEAGALHLKAEVQGLDRPLLPDRVIERFDLARIIESQAAGVHLRSQQARGKLRLFDIVRTPTLPARGVVERWWRVGPFRPVRFRRGPPVRPLCR